MKYTFFILMSLGALFSGCRRIENIDKQKPVIALSIPGAFPRNCDTLYFGEPFDFIALFTDNVELGSLRAYSIDIHHNFDHHSHSTEQLSACSFDAAKQAKNAFLMIQDFSLASGLKEIRVQESVFIPSGNALGLFDEGDYHFFVSLTDKEGWSAKKGLSIKMMHRPKKP